MIRPVLTEIALFIAPFVIYAAFLIASRGGLLEKTSWNFRILFWLTGIGLVLMIGSFVFLVYQHPGQPPGSVYVPPHMEDGKLVPGQFR